jgi:RNAse (barnase) inhibitor barstar
VERAARAGGLKVVRVDLSVATTKAELLGMFGKALSAPSYFSKNWDALSDCLTDLSWLDAPGWVMVLRGTAGVEQAHPRDFATLLEVLEAAAEYWTSRKRTFRVAVLV